MKKVILSAILPFFLFVTNSNAQAWYPLGTGTDGQVGSVFNYNGYIYAAGYFLTAGSANTNHIAKWNGVSWSALGLGMDTVTNKQVTTMADFNGALYVGGSFTVAGGTPASAVAKWDGGAWSALGSGITGGGLFNMVAAMEVYKGALYVGGIFKNAGGSSATYIAKWDGATWSAVGSGVNWWVYSLEVYNGELYVGGSFDTAGGIFASSIAKWNGTTWSAIGSGTNGEVREMAVLNGELYGAGTFTSANGVAANYTAKYNGATWAPLGSGMNGQCTSIKADTINNLIYVGGLFSTAGGVSASRIAKWSGTNWTGMSTGMNGTIWAIEVMNGDVYAGGDFTSAGGASVSNIAVWQNPNAGPAINTTNPANNDTSVAIDKTVIIGFTKPIDTSTFTFSCTPDAGGWVESWNNGSTSLTLSHTDFVNSASYTVEVTYAEDTSGNLLIGGSVPNPWTFTTESIINNTYDLYPQNKLVIYPNPFSDKCTIILPKDYCTNAQLSFHLYDLYGREIKVIEHISERYIQLMKGDLPKGVYYFSFETKIGKLGGGSIIIY